MLLRSLLLIVALVPTTVTAELYRWSDDQGRVHYGDRPPETASTRKLAADDLPVSTVTGTGLRDGERQLLDQLAAEPDRPVESKPLPPTTVVTASPPPPPSPGIIIRRYPVWPIVQPYPTPGWRGHIGYDDHRDWYGYLEFGRQRSRPPEHRHRHRPERHSEPPPARKPFRAPPVKSVGARW